MKQVESAKNTIIYGGAFNPPTRAHHAILQACIDYAQQPAVAADVWLMPSGNRTDKTIEVSYEERLEMLRALCEDVIKRTVEVCIETMELDQPEQTETYDTVVNLQQKYPDREFIWVFGSDSVATMREWDHGDWLYENLQMLIVERPDSPVTELGHYANLLYVEASKISSTEVRERIQANEPVDHLVPPSVLSRLYT